MIVWSVGRHDSQSEIAPQLRAATRDRAERRHGRLRVVSTTGRDAFGREAAPRSTIRGSLSRRREHTPVGRRDRMALVPHLVDLVREATRGDNFDLELAALDSDDPEEIATLLSDFLSARLASVEDGVFYHRGTGIVAGALLSDGRLAVMKVHR
jgi:hypothetical protein